MWFYKLNACTWTVNFYFYMKIISGIYTCHYRCGVVNWFHTCPYSPEIIEKKIRPTILPLELTLFMIKDEPWYDNINSVSHPKTIKFKTRKIFQPYPPKKKNDYSVASSFDDDDWHSLSKCRVRYRFFCCTEKFGFTPDNPNFHVLKLHIRGLYRVWIPSLRAVSGLTCHSLVGLLGFGLHRVGVCLRAVHFR